MIQTLSLCPIWFISSTTRRIVSSLRVGIVAFFTIWFESMTPFAFSKVYMGQKFLAAIAPFSRVIVFARPWSRMFISMSRRIDNFQIFYPVVCFFTIFMVNVFFSCKNSAKMFFHDMPMLICSFAVYAYNSVPGRINIWRTSVYKKPVWISIFHESSIMCIAKSSCDNLFPARIHRTYFHNRPLCAGIISATITKRTIRGNTNFIAV